MKTNYDHIQRQSHRVQELIGSLAPLFTGETHPELSAELPKLRAGLMDLNRSLKLLECANAYGQSEGDRSGKEHSLTPVSVIHQPDLFEQILPAISEFAAEHGLELTRQSDRDPMGPDESCWLKVPSPDGSYTCISVHAEDVVTFCGRFSVGATLFSHSWRRWEYQQSEPIGCLQECLTAALNWLMKQVSDRSELMPQLDSPASVDLEARSVLAQIALTEETLQKVRESIIRGSGAQIIAFKLAQIQLQQMDDELTIQSNNLQTRIKARIAAGPDAGVKAQILTWLLPVVMQFAAAKGMSVCETQDKSAAVNGYSLQWPEAADTVSGTIRVKLISEYDTLVGYKIGVEATAGESLRSTWEFAYPTESDARVLPVLEAAWRLLKDSGLVNTGSS